MRRNSKIWLSIGAFVLTGSVAANATDLGRSTDEGPKIGVHDAWAQGGEGGEGGEGGINLETVENDPAEYAIALQVIAAHFDAGLAAYTGGEPEAGAQLFAHGHSEIYAVMDELFKKLGVTTLGPSLEAAVAAAADKKPVAEVRRRAADVRKALQDAARRGPQAASPERLQVFLAAAMIERAAAQYSVTLKDKTLEPYLDGLGFAVAARREAQPILTGLKKADKKAAAAIEQALQLVARAYPGIKRAAKAPVSEAELLVAASRATLAVSSYR